MNSIAIFCGSSKGNQSIFEETAIEVGRFFAKKNIDIIFGGGKVGLMGAMADAALEAEGRVIGVIPDFLKTKEVTHFDVSELIRTNNMHERKQIMYDLSDAFLIMPGGFGTLDELFEITTWAQLGQHGKPIGILNTNQYFNPLMSMIGNMVSFGFLKTENTSLLISDSKVEDLFTRMLAYQAGDTTKWLE